jgi:long-chain acyl-CoA synthetase
MAISEYLVTDDLTVLLGFIGVSVFLLQNLYKPQPLVHPILLGRQSDAGRVRQPGESALYRNYGIGLTGRFPVRPEKDVDLVNDFVKSQFESPRTLWSTKITNAKLKERISAFGAGISRLIPEESSVLLLLNDSLEFVIADLALAKHSIVSMTLSSRRLLSRVLEAHPPSAIIVGADFLPHVLELIYDAREHHHKIIVVGQSDKNHIPKAAQEVELISWTQVEADGAQVNNGPSLPTIRPIDPFTLAFFETPCGDLQGVRFTHSNFTSGVTAIRALFPPSIALSTLDTIVSGHSLSTPFGRAVTYTALYESASFATLESTRMYDNYDSSPGFKDLPHDCKDVLSATKFPIPSPTVLFVDPGHLNYLSTSIISRAKKSFLMYPLGWRHKLAALAEGFLSRESLWDRTVFDGPREYIMGGMANTVKAIVVSGGPLPNDSLSPARVALSIPLITAHIHPSTSGPLFATHAFDLQSLPSVEGEPAHVGAPSVNVEVKLRGLKDAEVESGGDPKGELLVRGPPVGVLLNRDGTETDTEGWVKTGELARVMTNGAFKVIGSTSR